MLQPMKSDENPASGPAPSGLDSELVAIDMGYGHLRPAHALSQFLGNQAIHLADQAPLATPQEQKKWQRARHVYELLSRAGKIKFAGPWLTELLQGVTKIPSLYPVRDLSSKTPAVKLLERAAQGGMGLGLAARLQRSKVPLLTTFFGPAVLSDYHGCERIYCVVTDSDVNRIWAPISPRRGKITYLVPTLRVRRRLKAYGVSGSRIVMTGYPLPHELVGGTDANVLRQNLRRRLVALDRRGTFLRECREEVSYFLGDLPSVPDAPPHLVFAVGGAGAQVEMVSEFLPSLAHSIRKGKLRLTLVAGLRPEVADRFRAAILQTELGEELQSGGISILLESTHDAYFSAFNRLMAQADILWTKPSELSFFGALGLPLIFSWPVGSHERYNRRWAINSGSGMKQGDLRHAGEWINEMLKDGTFAGAAWTGYMRMPKFGLYRVVEEVFGAAALAHLLEQDPAAAEPQQAAVLRIR